MLHVYNRFIGNDELSQLFFPKTFFRHLGENFSRILTHERKRSKQKVKVGEKFVCLTLTLLIVGNWGHKESFSSWTRSLFSVAKKYPLPQAKMAKEREKCSFVRELCTMHPEYTSYTSRHKSQGIRRGKCNTRCVTGFYVCCCGLLLLLLYPREREKNHALQRKRAQKCLISFMYFSNFATRK